MKPTPQKPLIDAPYFGFRDLPNFLFQIGYTLLVWGSAFIGLTLVGGLGLWLIGRVFLGR